MTNNKKSTRYYSDRHERRTAKELNAKVQTSSGSSDFLKGDLYTKDCFVECKTSTTEKKSFSIKKEWFAKQKQEAAFMGKPYSAVVFNFGPGEENHYIIDEYLFQFLKDKLNELEETL